MTTSANDSPHGSELLIDVRSADDDQLVAREPLRRGDLATLRDEAWLWGMRTGCLGDNIDALRMTTHRGEAEGEGFVVGLTDLQGSYRHPFSLRSVTTPFERIVGELRQSGVLEEDARYRFSLGFQAEPSAQQVPVEAAADDGTSTSVSFESAPLRDYLARSECLSGPFDSVQKGESLPVDAPPPVFVPEDVWQEAHALARRGGEKESAAMWTGRLMQDTDSPERFVCVDACIAAQGAVETQYSVTFSGETWDDLNQRLSERRTRLNRPHELFCGSVHGHNFLPSADSDGNRMCEACATAKVCSRSTAAASTEDEAWHRAVFARQPWAVLLVHGWTARGEEDWKLYGLHDGGLAPRPVHILRAN